MSCIILAFDGESVTANHFTDKGGTVETAVVETKKDVAAFVKKHPGLSVMCSSSMDFPGDYTTDKRLIARVRRIRGPSPWA